MKKVIYNILILTLIVLTQSCVNEEADLFDASSAERTNAAVKEYQDILVAAPNGWLMEYYAGVGDHKIGGYNFICSFDAKGNVVMAGEMEVGSHVLGDKVNSMYQIIADQSAVLSFNTYNEIFHTFSEPKGTSAIYGYGGDYEFVIMKIDANKIELQGKKYGNKIVMTRMATGVDWKNYLEDIDVLFKASAFPYYQLSVGAVNKDLLAISLFERSFRSENLSLNAVYNKDGIKLYEPLVIDGKTAQNFIWDATEKSFICTDKEATDIRLKGFIPEDYVSYESYLGTYTFTYYNGTINRPVTISKLEDKNTFLLSGAFGFDAILQYDFGTGYVYLLSQKIGEYNGNDVVLASWDPVNGYLTWSTDAGMRGIMKNNSFILEDFGSFSGYTVDAYILWQLSGGTSAGQYPVTPNRFPFKLTFTKQ